VYWVVQSIVLWDVHVLAALEGWQARIGPHARAWLAALGDIEALAALAALAHAHPDWATPTIDETARYLEARQAGHPLLAPETRVDNDVALGPPGTFLLVTGSNMAGKSTFLRTIGTNIVLAQAGGPVCAHTFHMPPLALYTSMRVHDSLERGVSTFLAEVLRLKQVVDAAREAEAGGRVLCYLLDEILQGTNTAERQIAAQRVIRFMLARGAIGAVSTHDLTLADAPEFTAVAHRVHFSETLQRDAGRGGPVMTFDYRLEEGLATSTNALRLLELLGLDERLAAASLPGSPDPYLGS
jgi:DNA mismatch repair ATPase MutS